MLVSGSNVAGVVLGHGRYSECGKRARASGKTQNDSSFHCHPSAEAGLWLVQEKEAGTRLVEAEGGVFFFHNEPFLCIGSSPGEGRGQKDHPTLLLSSTTGQVQAWGWLERGCFIKHRSFTTSTGPWSPILPSCPAEL